MGDRIAVMRAGRVEQVGTFDELYATPANAFVATFVGAPAMTLFPARVEDRGLVLGGRRWDLPARLADALPPGEVRLGVRPEGWRLDAGGLPVSVAHVERLPAERASLVHGRVANAGVAVLAPLDAPREVAVEPDFERAYFFAADSEATLATPEPQEELF